MYSSPLDSKAPSENIEFKLSAFKVLRENVEFKLDASKVLSENVEFKLDAFWFPAVE